MQISSYEWFVDEIDDCIDWFQRDLDYSKLKELYNKLQIKDSSIVRNNPIIKDYEKQLEVNF